jgi:hypothetical protein
MNDDWEPEDPVDMLAARIEKMLPDCLLQNEVTATILGSVLGFVCGFVITRAGIRLLFPHDEKDER